MLFDPFFIVLLFPILNNVNPSNLGERIMAEHMRRTIIRGGFSPKNILDVGANRGLWSLEVKEVFPSASFFLIEGNNNLRDVLASRGFPFTINLVSDQIKNVTFYRNGDKDATGSSMFLENTKYFESPATYATNITAYPIDEIVRQNNVGPFQMMKMDIQGAELLAIEGALKTLDTVDVLVTEVPVMNYNQGAPSFLQIFNALDDLGFAFFDILDTLRWVNITNCK